MTNYAAIVTDVCNGYTYRTATATTKERARKLAEQLVVRKNIDYADIDVMTLSIL